MRDSGTRASESWQQSRWRRSQRELAKKVIIRDDFNNPPNLVAGVDVSYFGVEAFSAAIVVDYNTLEPVEAKAAKSIAGVPYVASFLAFREVRPLTRVIRRLKSKVDIFIVNAHGIAHPERCGCASHLGVALNIPTIGVANTILHGRISPTPEVEGMSYLKDGEEIIGVALTTRIGSRPIFVSVGHRISLGTAIGIVRRTVRESRMPEPMRLAHTACREAKKRWTCERNQMVSNWEGD